MDLQTAWQHQIEACHKMGSAFTARVLEAAWKAHEATALFAPWPGDAWADAAPLRVAGALHQLALTQADAGLAAAYACLTNDTPALQVAVQQALAKHPDVLADYLSRPPQTNEIGRSAVLLLGFAEVARHTGLPLRTLELGASAGLNQLWHRYRYDHSGSTWGDAHSPVLIRSQMRGPGAMPALPSTIDVASHSGCDAQPLHLNAPNSALRLVSYVWADQTERLQRLRAAIGVAQAQGLAIAAQDALPWLQTQLAQPSTGMATVIYHSVVWQYMPEATQQGLQTTIEATAQRATHDAPLAWLAFEPNSEGRFELTLQQWPGDQRRVLAQAHPHGTWIEWVEPR